MRGIRTPIGLEVALHKLQFAHYPSRSRNVKVAQKRIKRLTKLIKAQYRRLDGKIFTHLTSTRLHSTLKQFKLTGILPKGTSSPHLQGRAMDMQIKGKTKHISVK